MFTTVRNKVVRVLLALMLAGTLLNPVLTAPAYAGDCSGNGSTSCVE